MLQQVFASPRMLELLGLGKNRLAQVPIAQRRLALKGASGFFSPFLRKRNQLPLVVEMDPEELDTTGMTGGASVSWSLVCPASSVRDVGVKFTTAGTAPGPLTYVTNLYHGATGSTFNGPGGTLDASGAMVWDGQRFTIAGAVSVGDTFTFSLITDPGVALATAQLAGYQLLHNRGIDPKTEQDLSTFYDAAMAFARALGAGEADLEKAEDATPNVAELGPRGSGQRNPWDWLGRR